MLCIYHTYVMYIPCIYIFKVGSYNCCDEDIPLNLAFWKEMQPQLFYTSTAADRGTLLSAAVPMVLALTRGGAAIFTRSTPGCGTLDGPSLAWAASLWPKLRRSKGSPGLRLPNERGQQRGPSLTSDLCFVYTWYIQVYTWYILS